MKQNRDAAPGGQIQNPLADRPSMPVLERETAPFRLVTAEFADLNGVKDQTVRKRFCLTGSYFGIRPCKLINGRLLWPAIQIGIDSGA